MMRIIIFLIAAVVAYNLFAPQHSQEQYEQAFLQENIKSLHIDDAWNIASLAINTPIAQHEILGKPVSADLKPLFNAYLQTIAYRLPAADTTITLTYQKSAFDQAYFDQYYLTAYQIHHLEHIQFSNGIQANLSIEDTVDILNNKQYNYKIADNMIAIKAADKNIILAYEANQLKSILVKERKEII